MRKLFALSFACLAVWGGGVATSTAEGHYLRHKKHLTLEGKLAHVKRNIEHDRNAITWLVKVRANLRHDISSLASSRYEFALHVNQAIRFHKKALNWQSYLLAYYQAKWDKLHPPLPPHLSAWKCIQSYEGSWQDDGAPFWGGLQMDWGFMSRYGKHLLSSKGTANNWTPLEQMWVAEKAYSSGRGFYPWPNTARYCGLI